MINMKSTLILSLLVFLTITLGCNKQDDTIYRVYVSLNGQPKVNSKVRIYGVNSINPPAIDLTEYTDANGLAEFNLNDYIKNGSAGGLTVDCYVHLLKFGPVDTVKTVFIEGFKTNKTDFKF